MSGDVQPRKRKDKKKKRESLDVRKSEGELIFSRKSSLQDDESSHGVHFTKMGTDDVHLHVQQEHGTGGHWCAKIIFFSLMTVLMGLVCLIILENRGIQDVDTPLSESRFSDYFNGWVDEHRDEHDDHHDSHGSVEHDDHEDDEHDDHDHDDEPFEEEVDHSEGEDEVADEEDENITPEEENDDENMTGENVTAEEADVDEEDEDEEEENATVEEDNATAEEEADENVTMEDENMTAEQNDEPDDDDDEDAYKTKEEDDNVTKETTKSTSKGLQDDEDDAFDEEDDDANFDSLEKVVDNDAAEIELLKEKARQQAAAESKQNAASAENDVDDEADTAPLWASSLAVKIGVGLALALVARLVLLRKNPISNEERNSEILMKRRLTIASPDDEEFAEEAPGDVYEPLPENDYSEEEIEIEEEIEYVDEDEEAVGEENQVDAGDNVYMPETFEQLHALYRPKNDKEETEMKTVPKPTQEQQKPQTYSYPSPYTTALNNSFAITNNNSNNHNEVIKDGTGSIETLHKSIGKTETTPTESRNAAFNKQSPAKEDAALKKDTTYDMDYEKFEKLDQDLFKDDHKHDMQHQPEHDDDIDYDEDDIYDDDSEEVEEDDEGPLDEDVDDDDDLDEEEVSDVDDTDLMNRLEAKYGKLPAKEYESDEDVDVPAWTRNY